MLAALLGSMGMAWAQAWAQVPALTGDAGRYVDQAYQAYAQKDFARALQQARAARKLRPDVVRLQELVLMAETAAEQTNTPKAAEPSAQQRAQQLAQQSYEKVMQSRQDASLIPWARSFIWQALQYDKQPLQWHVLAVRLALVQGQWGDAVFGADAGLQLHPGEPALVQAKAFALQQKGQARQAFALLKQMLGTNGLSADDRVSLLLQAADTALEAGQFEQGLAEVRQLQALQVPGAKERQQLLKAGVALPLAMPAPELGCNEQAICVARYALDIEQGLFNAAQVAAQKQQWPLVQTVAGQLVQLKSTRGLYWQWLIGAQLGQGMTQAARTSAQLAMKALDAKSSGLNAAEMAQIAQIAQIAGQS
ncbi:hypothetical protein DZC30_19780 [Comamonas testosteroni]|uniref:Tetratricopeptide repeat protein n=1 Tax=Comamonas testosteroni TaxID=285 RepID=A0A373FBH0_COMTE|nr:hypothetical protein DZC30_19780 [Comamonas testosteroni]